MTTALEIAGFLEGGSDQFNAEAAAELRRLHAINAELVEKVKKLEAAIESVKRTHINANFQRYL